MTLSLANAPYWQTSRSPVLLTPRWTRYLRRTYTKHITANQRRTFRRTRRRWRRRIRTTKPRLAQSSLLKRIRLGAATAVCRLVPESGTVRLVRHVVLTGIAPKPLLIYPGRVAPRPSQLYMILLHELKMFESSFEQRHQKLASESTRSWSAKKNSAGSFSLFHFIISEKTTNYFREL